MKKVKRIILTLTEKCNLSCVYCYEKSKSQKSITFEAAKEIILKEFAGAERLYDVVYLDLYGGEPFCEFELIKKIVEFVRTNISDIDYQILAMTNGTLLNGAVKEWLSANYDIFIVGLSMDGNREVQNANRGNSFEYIDLDFYREHYAKQGVKMTVSRQSLPYLADSVIFFHENGLYCSCSLALGEDWSDPENAAVLEDQLTLLNDYYIAHPRLQPCSMLGRSILAVADSEAGRRGWCDAGVCAVVYDVNGEKYPCHFFTALSAGAEIADRIKNVTFPPVIHADTEGKCLNCRMKSACPTCYAYNYISTGDFFEQDSSLCRLAHVIIKKRAELIKRKLDNCLINPSKETREKLATSLIIIDTL